METIKLKSPVDGSIYAERPVATDAQMGAGRRGSMENSVSEAPCSTEPSSSDGQARVSHAPLPCRMPESPGVRRPW